MTVLVLHLNQYLIECYNTVYTRAAYDYAPTIGLPIANVYKHVLLVLTLTNMLRCLCICISDASSNMTEMLATFAIFSIVLFCIYFASKRPCRRIDVVEIERLDTSLPTQFIHCNNCEIGQIISIIMYSTAQRTKCSTYLA